MISLHPLDDLLRKRKWIQQHTTLEKTLIIFSSFLGLVTLCLTISCAVLDHKYKEGIANIAALTNVTATTEHLPTINTARSITNIALTSDNAPDYPLNNISTFVFAATTIHSLGISMTTLATNNMSISVVITTTENPPENDTATPTKNNLSVPALATKTILLPEINTEMTAKNNILALAIIASIHPPRNSATARTKDNVPELANKTVNPPGNSTTTLITNIISTSALATTAVYAPENSTVMP